MNDDTYLRRLNIRHFRTFGELNIDLPEGPSLTVIHGPNGLGKSSLFDAIEWTLTNEVQRLAQAKGTPAERERAIRRAGAGRVQTMVALEFSDGLLLERKLVGGLEGDPNKLVRSSWPVPDKLATYLQFTHFLGQSARHRFINKEDKERLEAVVGPARLEEIQQLGETLLRLKRSALRPLKAEAEQAIHLAEARMERWRSAITDRTSYAALAQADHALDPLAAKAEAAAIAAVLKNDYNAAETNLSSSDAEGALAATGATLAERMERWQEWLRMVEAAEQTLDLWEAARERLETLHAEQAQVKAALAASGARIEQLSQAEAELRATRDSRRVPLQVADERLGQLRNLADWVAYGEGIKRQLAELHPRLHAAERQRDAAREAVQQAELRKRAAEEAAARWRAAMEKRDRAKVLEERVRRYSEQRTQRADRERIWLAAEPNLLAASQREGALAEQVAQIEHELAEARAQLLVAREHADAVQQAVAAIAARLGEKDEFCPVCGTKHDSPKLRDEAQARAHAHHGPLAEIEQRVGRLTADLSVLGQQLREVRTERTRYEGERATLEAARRSEDAAWAELAAEPELAGQSREHADAWVAGLVMGSEMALNEAVLNLSAGGDLATLSAAVEAARAHLGEMERQAAQAAQQRTEFQANMRKADETTATIARQVDIGDDWQRVLESRVQGATEQVAGLSAEIAAYDLQIVEVNSRLEGERTVAAQQGARRTMLHERTRATEAELADLAALWRKVGLEEPIGSEERTHKLTYVRGRLVSLEGVKARHELVVAGLRVWQGQTDLKRAEDELTKVRSELCLDDDAQIENKLSDDLAAARRRLGKLEAFEQHAEDGYQKSKNIGELIQNKTLMPLNKVVGKFSAALMPEDHQMTVECRFGHGQGASIKVQQFGSAVNPELYLSEGQLAALNIALLMSASITYPWSRWRALLMDDPLHHNDVIHASAFMDVVCNLITDRDYQVILSTHDGAEADYFLRKARSAGIPVRSCSLLNSSAQGVAYQVV